MLWDHTVSPADKDIIISEKEHFLSFLFFGAKLAILWFCFSLWELNFPDFLNALIVTSNQFKEIAYNKTSDGAL